MSSIINPVGYFYQDSFPSPSYKYNIEKKSKIYSIKSDIAIFQNMATSQKYSDNIAII